MASFLSKIEGLLLPEIAAVNAKVETDLEAIWVGIKPGVEALGKTLLSQIVQLAETFVLSGGNAAQTETALAAMVPADTAAAHALVSAAFTIAIANLTQPAPASTPTLSAPVTPAPTPATPATA